MEENEKKKIIVKAKTNITISEIAKKQIEESKYPVVGAIFNNEYKNLDDELQEDGTLELININSKEGMKIYRRTLTYIMGMAFWKLYPEARVVVNYQLTNAMYCNLENMKVTEEMLYNVQEEMKRIVEKDLKIEKRTMTREEAGKFYEKNNTGKGRLQYDLATNEKINMSYCEDYFNYFYEIIATHTGVTKIFELKKYYDGFLLRYPSSQDVNVLPEYEETKKLSWALHEYETIYKVLNVGTVYRLNKRVKEGSIKELILLSEALHEKKIANIAMLVALAIIFSYVEVLIPINIGIPGVKLGLANLVIVIALYSLDMGDVWLISLVRIVLVGFMFGSLMSIAYSLAGAIVSLIAMMIIKKTDFFGIMGVSIIGAVCHNMAQIAVAAFVVKNNGIYYYVPMLLIAGVITGGIIGVVSHRVLNILKK